MKRILVTAISGDIANGILKILKEQSDCELYGCDINDIAVGMDLVKVFWKCSYAIAPRYVDELIKKCEEYKITHLIPVNEREIEVISAEKERFINTGVKLLIQDKRILDICLDKYRTYEYLKHSEIKVPNTYIDKIGTCWDGTQKYICKPRKSNGSKNLTIVSSQKELLKIDIENQVIQEYIDSDEEYTVGIFRYEDITNIIAFKRILRTGYSYYVELSHDNHLKSVAREIADIFFLKGYINVQLKKKDNRYYVFEINPRISGTVRFRHMLGFSDVLWWLDLLDGKSIGEYHCQYHNAIGIRELNEKFLVLD